MFYLQVLLWFDGILVEIIARRRGSFATKKNYTEPLGSFIWPIQDLVARDIDRPRDFYSIDANRLSYKSQPFLLRNCHMSRFLSLQTDFHLIIRAATSRNPVVAHTAFVC